MSKSLFVIGAGRWQIPLIEKAKEMGLFVIVTDRDLKAPGFQWADISQRVDTTDVQRNLSLAMELEIDGVTAMATDYAVPTVAAVAQALGLVGNTIETARSTFDKGCMRRRLAEHAVPSPDFTVVASSSSLPAFSLPIVVKPVDACGSKGVRRVEQIEDYGPALQEALTHSQCGRAIVEEYMAGEEVSVEGLVVRGQISDLVITGKQVTADPYFVEIAHTIPSGQPADLQERIRAVVRQAVAALRIENSGIHAEVKITADGPKIVEIASRLGGGYITSHLVPLATGWDLVGDVIRLALGELHTPPRDVARHRCFAGVRFVGSGRNGILRSILTDSIPTSGIEAVDLFKRPGDRLDSMRNSNDRLGAVIATAASREALSRILESALARIVIEVDH